MRSRSAVSCARTAPASVHAAASASATTGGDSLPSALAMNASTKNVVAESESIRVEPLDAVTTLPVIDTAPSLSPQASRPARSWWITAALCALNALLAGSAPPGAYASTDSFATRVLLMAHVFLGVCALVASMPRLAQPLSYHNFVDQRALCCGVPNTLDVAVRVLILCIFGHSLVHCLTICS